nr:MAG TPA: hypothetical protein [Caudoviricetes sp.]
MKYEFHVGDYVEDVTGRIGYINSICQCEYCKARGFYEPRVTYTDGDKDCITAYECEQGFPYYKRIGQYDFTKKDNDKDEGKIEPLVKSWILEDSDGKGEYHFDSREAIKKINELVDVINELKTDYEKHLRAHELTER